MATVTIYKCSTPLSIIITLHFILAYLSCSPPHRLYRCGSDRCLIRYHFTIFALRLINSMTHMRTLLYMHMEDAHSHVRPPKASVLHCIPIFFIIFFFITLDNIIYSYSFEDEVYIFHLRELHKCNSKTAILSRNDYYYYF